MSRGKLLPSLGLIGLAVALSFTTCDESEHALSRSDEPIPGEILVARDTDDDGRGELYAVAADGSEARRIASEEGFSSLSLSPDGRTIAAIQGGGDSQPVVLVDVETGKVSPVETAPGAYQSPQWSPDGDQIVFTGIDYSRIPTTGQGAFGDQIFIADASGSGVRLVTPESIDGAAFPSWSPDGTRIAYVYDSALWVINDDGTNEQAITHGLHTLLDPAWSPVDNRIVFTGYGNEFPATYIVNADGTGQEQLSPDGVQAMHPMWSPDGNHIAFATYESGMPRMYIVSQDGRDTRTTASSTGVEYLSWSPDGEWIAFTTVFGDGDEGISAIHLKVVNVLNDDAKPHTILKDLSDSTPPAWRSN